MDHRGARIRSVLRAGGPARLVGRGAARLLSPGLRVRRLLFFATDLTAPLAPVPPATVPLDIRVATRAELEAAGAELRLAGTSAEEACRQLDAGDVPVGAFAGGRLAHLQWITFRSPWVDEIQRWLRLGPGEACGYAAYTMPAWRGHGIHACASRFLNEEERRRGATRHISWVWADNVASLRSFAKLGRRRTRTVWSVWVWGMRQPLVLGATASGSPSLEAGPPPATGGSAAVQSPR